MKKRKILFVLPSFAGGGAERVVLTLLRHLDRERFIPVLAVFRAEGPYAGDVPEDVETHDLGVHRFRQGLWKLVRLVRRVKPDVVFSTLDHANLATLLVAPFFPRGTRVVVRQTEVLSRYLHGTLRARRIVYRLLYRRAHRIVCQSDHMASELAKELGLPGQTLARVYNPVDVERVQARAKASANPFADAGPGPHLVVAGRLAEQKALHRIIDHLPAWTDRFPHLRLWLLGKGPLERALRQRTAQKGVAEHVRFAGFQANPHAWFKHADLFLLSSLYEGSPNALLEALACGCPALVLDHPGGTREIGQVAGATSCRIVEAFPYDLGATLNKARPARDLTPFHVETAMAQFEALLAA